MAAATIAELLLFSGSIPSFLLKTSATTKAYLSGWPFSFVFFEKSMRSA